MSNNEYVDELAYSWLEMHKKSAVTYLVLRSLSKQPRWSKDIAEWVERKTSWGIDERSLYRILRRLEKQSMIDHTTVKAPRTGAERKVYAITSEGRLLLREIRQELSYL